MENLFEYTQAMADAYTQASVTDGDEETMGEIHFDFTNGAVAFATYLLNQLKEDPKSLPELISSLEQMVSDAMINNLMLSQTEIYEA